MQKQRLLSCSESEMASVCDQDECSRELLVSGEGSNKGGTVKLRVVSMLVLVLVLSLLTVSAYADSIVLQSAGTFAVLAGAGVTNTGTTTINGGNVGSYGSTTSITGGVPCPAANCIAITGGTVLGTATATNKSDLVTAINDLALLSSLNIGTAGLSGNVTVTPGVYSSGSTFELNGTVTLDAEGLSNADFIFLAGSSLTADVGSNVVLENPGTDDGVYWVEEGSGSATLDGSTFVGNVLSNTSITFDAAVTITCGSALANTGDVTMINDTIDTNTSCSGSPFISTSPETLGEVVETSGGSTPPPAGTIAPVATTTTTPDPGTFTLLSSGLLAMVFLTFRKGTADGSRSL